jgi:hypothetical protein
MTDEAKILAGLYGPLLRRMIALEDLIPYLVEQGMFPDDVYAQIKVMMGALGYKRSIRGRWEKIYATPEEAEEPTQPNP